MSTQAPSLGGLPIEFGFPVFGNVELSWMWMLVDRESEVRFGRS